MYRIKVSKENYDVAKGIDFSELEGRVKFDDANCIIEVPKADYRLFQVIITEEVDVNGLSEDQEEVLPYGRKVYALYDEILVVVAEIRQAESKTT